MRANPASGVCSVLVALCVWSASVLLGCEHDEPIHSYHVRGVITELSGQGADARISIHHEHVPSFVDRDGHSSDMPSMTMIFGLGPKIAPAELHVGDKLAFDFDVRFSQTPALLLTQASKLPPDTTLALLPDTK